MQLKNGIWTLAISPSTYVKEGVENCMDYISEYLNKDFLTWLQTHVQPVMIVQSSVQMLHHISNFWIFKLGHTVISMEVSLLHLKSVLACEGHIINYFIFRLHHSSHLCMDPTCPDIQNKQLPTNELKVSITVKDPLTPNPTKCP